MNQRTIEGCLATRPTREDVEALQVGGLAPDVWGRMRAVTEIYARGEDTAGRAYVCYYTAMSATSSVSGSMKEGETVSTLPLVNRFGRVAEVPFS